jgi:HAE1 family hydrophobic/amphiphilic exporter-1
VRDTTYQSVFSVTLRRPVAILMVTLASVVFGIFSYRLLPIELMPEITYPSVTVRTEYPGAAPEEVEENVTRLVEEALGVVGGLVRLSSISRAELSDVTLEFAWDTPMGEAWQEVTERLDTVFLPEDAGKPLILRYDPSLDPVLRLALASSREEDQTAAGLKRLRTFAEEELKKRLEQVEGVAAVRVLGGLEEQVSVDLDEEALRSTGLSIQEVARRLEVENVNLAGGDIKEGDTQYLVRTVNEFRSLDEIAELVVASVGGRELKLRDVGVVRSGWADREVITRFKGEEAVEVEIQREADANMIVMAATVRRAVDGSRGDPGLRGLLPEGWSLEVISDRSTFIDAAVDEVRVAAVVGGLLAVLVLYLFLRDFRPTAVISVAIPVSVAATFAPMNLSGLSLNIMSLGGLALGIGMLVDSGIVVVESITRCREEGDDNERAVVRGTSEVGGAVVASTLTTVAVFAPMVFVIGVAGEVFADLALTVVYSLMASLAVALFLVPSLSSRLGDQAGPDDPETLTPRDRIARSLRYRSLGPASAQPTGPFARRLSRALPAAPLFALAAGLLARSGSTVPAAIVGAPPAALLVCVLLFNGVSRVRSRRGLAGIVGAALLLPVDAVLFVLESAWLVVVWAVVLLGVPLVVVGRLVGRVSRLVLAPALWAVSALLELLQRVYPGIIRAALHRRGVVLALAAAAMALTVVGVLDLDTSLIPEVHQGEFDLELTLPVGTPLERTLEAVAPLETVALQDPRIERLLLKVGADPEADSSPEEGEHTARLTVQLAPDAPAGGPMRTLARLFRRIVIGLTHAGEGGVEAVREAEVADDLRRALGSMPELQAKLTRPVLFSFRTPIEVEVEAFELDRLRLLGDAVAERMAEIPSLTDVKSSARPGSPEVQIVYDREALVRYGLDLRAVADLVRTKVQGESASEYRKRERRIDIVVRLTESDRATLRQLSNLVVNPGAPVPIPLSAVADVTIGTAPADIRRVGQRRVSLVTANVRGRGLGGASEEIRRRLNAMEWSEGTGWRLSGQVQEMERSTASLWTALAISVFLVYVVMASQFESILQPLIIMITVPLALVGVVAMLQLLAIPLSVVVFLGMIMLAGIVVNNAIVLVDYVNTLRRRGLEIEEALVEAGRVRLRPILMTTSTTVLALLPLALGLGDGAEIRTPMALAVIAGLLTSTVLTLIVLPTAYAAIESAVAALRPRKAGAPEKILKAERG